MKNVIKNQKILFGIILAFVFIASVSFTYAYFSAGITGNEEANQQVVTAGTLELTYTDGPEIRLSNIEPSAFITKTVSIENTGSLDVFYQFQWKSLLNEITEGELKISATCVSYLDGEVSGTCSSIEELPIGNIAGIIKAGIGIASGYKQVYEFKIELIETNSQQNYNQGKKFAGELNILESIGYYNVSGLLTNSSDSAIENATIELDSLSANTDSNGKFTFENVSTGSHSITVKNSEEETIATDSLQIVTGSSTNVNGKTIISNLSNRVLNVTIKLGDNNISSYTINSTKWYETCSVDSANLKCKMLSNSVAQSDANVDFSVRSNGCIEHDWDSGTCKTYDNTKITNGLYYTTDLSKTEDNDSDGIGERVYYYRGTVTNNKVIFGGYCWIIIRTNEDGSVKLLYNGLPSDGKCNEETANIGRAKYNKQSTDNAFVGYMHGDNIGCSIDGYSRKEECTSAGGTWTASTSYNQAHANTVSSNIKKVLDSWFTGSNPSSVGADCQDSSYEPCVFTSLSSKLNDSTNKEKIANTIYCNDRSISSESSIGSISNSKLGYGDNITAYGAMGRMVSLNDYWHDNESLNPQYKCALDNDKFTLSVGSGGVSGFGNNSLTYPIGLLTADELIYAGYGYYSQINNQGNFLNSYLGFQLLSPFAYYYDYEDKGTTFFVTQDDSYLKFDEVSYDYSVIPVISLKSNINVSGGNGDFDTPYIIE